MKKFLHCLPVALMLVLPVVSCSSGDGDEPEPVNPDVPNPSQKVDDPSGTVRVSLRNANSDGGTRSYLCSSSNIRIDAGDNFIGAYFARYAKVAGLGNVAMIPTTGYATKMAVTPGDGYVAWSDGEQRWYRMYVEEYIVGTDGGVLGATVKYQAPFNGIDEALKPDVSGLTFPSEGGTGEVRFNNTSIVPFTIVSYPDWCYVYKASTRDQYFLTDAISVSAGENESASSMSGVIKLETGHGKTLEIPVTLAGSAPFLNASDVTVDHFGGETTVALSTNIPLESITVTSDQAWVSASVSSDDAGRAAVTPLRFIDGKKVEPGSRASGRSATSANVVVSVQENCDAEPREATITLTASGVSETFKVTQQAGSINFYDSKINNNTLSFTYAEQWTTVKLYYRGDWYSKQYDTLPTEVEASSNQNWCTVDLLCDVRQGYDDKPRMTISVEANPIESERTALVTVKAKNGTLSNTLTVIQAAGGISIDGGKEPLTLYIDKNDNIKEFNITSSAGDIEPVSDSTWLTAYVAGGKLSVMATTTDVSRQGKITFKNSVMSITVHQSKYAVGDEYDEDGVTGTIWQLGEVSCIGKKVDGSYCYSTQSITTGATSLSDGESNTAKIHSIPNWREYYPLFVAVDDLNVNGETGWYVPAREETVMLVSALRFSYNETSSSTELDQTRFYTNSTFRAKSDTRGAYDFNIYGVKKIDAFK